MVRPVRAPHVLPRSRLLLALCAVAVAAGVLGGVADTQGAAQRPDLRIRLQFARPGGIYDPAYWRYTSDGWVYPALFNQLVRKVPGTGGDLEPDLAESWEVSADGTTYTFHLRGGVQFQRGYGELTADDVVFSIQRQIDDPEATFHSIYSNVSRIEAVDDHTVRIVLAEAQPSFLLAVLTNPNGAGFVVSRRAVEELGLDEFARHPVGTGPYVLEEVTPTDEVVLTSHDDYFGGMPSARSITFVHVAEEAVAAAALERGELQAIYTRGNPEVAQELLSSPDVQAQTVVEYYNIMHIAFSPNFAPVQDVRVRQALAYALDKSAIALLLPGLDQPADVMRPSQLPGGTDDVPTYGYDPDRARSLLREAGEGDLAFTLMFQTREPEATIAQWLADSWEAVGVSVTLEGTEATTAHDMRTSGDFEVTFSATSRAGDPDYFFTDVLHSSSTGGAGSNFSGYSAADDLIEEARYELDPQRRQELYEQVQRQVMEDLPVIPLLYRAYVAAWREPIESLVPDSTIQFWPDTIEVVSGAP
ncbi:MAG TPA: ABC transporter substrate-binding protein [Trueperaceae bacterium]